MFRTWRIALDSSITVVLTQYHVKASWKNKFLDVLNEYIVSSLKASGNIMAEAYYEKGDSCIMWIIERWSNHTFYINNRKSAAANAVGTLTKTGLESPVETIFIKDLELLSKEASPNPLTIMLFVNVKAGTENHFRTINRDVMPVLREDPGLLTFQLSQVSSHKTRFIVYKKFRNWDAFQYHIKDPALDPVIKFLQTSIKEPPFEKGYHHLIQFAPHF